MALKIRLARGGAKQRPFYRIVVAEADAPRDGRFVEKLGTYNPMLEKNDPQRVTLNKERIQYWLSVGAQPTERVARFLGEAKLREVPAPKNSPQKSLPKKKAQERLKQEAEARQKLEEEKAKPPVQASPQQEEMSPTQEEASLPVSETPETIEETSSVPEVETSTEADASENTVAENSSSQEETAEAPSPDDSSN